MTTRFEAVADKEEGHVVLAARPFMGGTEGTLTHFIVEPEDGYKLVRKLLDALQELGA